MSINLLASFQTFFFDLDVLGLVGSKGRSVEWKEGGVQQPHEELCVATVLLLRPARELSPCCWSGTAFAFIGLLFAYPDAMEERQERRRRWKMVNIFPSFFFWEPKRVLWFTKWESVREKEMRFFLLFVLLFFVPIERERKRKRKMKMRKKKKDKIVVTDNDKS